MFYLNSYTLSRVRYLAHFPRATRATANAGWFRLKSINLVWILKNSETEILPNMYSNQIGCGMWMRSEYALIQSHLKWVRSERKRHFLQFTENSANDRKSPLNIWYGIDRVLFGMLQYHRLIGADEGIFQFVFVFGLTSRFRFHGECQQDDEADVSKCVD